MLSDASNATSPLAKALYALKADTNRDDGVSATEADMRAASQLLAKYLNQAGPSLSLVNRQRVVHLQAWLVLLSLAPALDAR